MNNPNTTHNRSPSVQAHHPLSVGWRGREDGARHAAMPQCVGGHEEPQVSVNTFPPYYCLFTLDGFPYGNFNSWNKMQSSTVQLCMAVRIKHGCLIPGTAYTIACIDWEAMDRVRKTLQHQWHPMAGRCLGCKTTQDYITFITLTQCVK